MPSCLQVKEQKKKKVVFIARVIIGERRGFLNVDEAAAALQEAFPGTFPVAFFLNLNDLQHTRSQPF